MVGKYPNRLPSEVEYDADVLEHVHLADLEMTLSPGPFGQDVWTERKAGRVMMGTRDGPVVHVWWIRQPVC